MKRVPIDLVLLALRESGVDASAGAVRNWVYRGKITYAKGYDLTEIVAYLDHRATTGRTQSRESA